MTQPHLDNLEADTGPNSSRPGTARLCVATRAVRDVGDMIRFVVGPDGDVVPDLRRKLPGRGVWITAHRPAVADAVKRKAFARGFRRDVRTPPDLADRVEQLLGRAALDALGMARKAGRVVTGFAKVEAALENDAVRALIHAGDAGMDGSRKIAAAAKRRCATAADPLAVIDSFTSAQLSLALGRPNVVHAAVLAGSAGDGFMARYGGLERYRAVDRRAGDL